MALLTALALVSLASQAAAAASDYVTVGANKLHFQQGSSSFVPIGLNIAWPDGSDPGGPAAYYDGYFSDLSANGANLARVWLGPNLVKSFNPLALLRNNYTTVDPEAASLVDSIVASAEKHGVKLLLTMDSFNGYCPSFANGNCKWDKSVFNSNNGGPLNSYTGYLLFWSDPTAKQAFKALLKFAADRWGGSSAVFAWELFNEVDLAGFDLPTGFYDWHEEMAKYLRKVDGSRHLISESFGLVAGNKWVDGSDSFDFTSTHNYARTNRGPQSPDVAKSNAYWSKTKTDWYHKPSIVGEFGCDDTVPNADANFRHTLHAGIWSPIFQGGAGTGMSWFWAGEAMDDDFEREWFLAEFRNYAKFVDVVGAELGSTPLGDIPFTALSVHVLESSEPNEELDTFGVVGGAGDVSLVWLHDAKDTCGSDTPTRSFEGVKIWLENIPGGNWKVTWFDTKTGVSSVETVGSVGGLTITAPAFVQDLAIIVSPAV
jgi:mannan endo-1,4-beta-mannosidase